MTYTGACPHGHAYTRENTMITHQNGKVCVACLRKPEAEPGQVFSVAQGHPHDESIGPEGARVLVGRKFAKA